MVLKLYGSSYTYLVAAVLHEKQVPFEFVSVDLDKAEHKSPEYLKKQPYGQAPYIVCCPTLKKTTGAYFKMSSLLVSGR